MTEKEFKARLAKIKSQEKRFGCKIEIKDLIDKDHLNCVWYGGDVGAIKYKGCTFVIRAAGDIRLHGRIKGETIDIVDKSNSGRVYDELGSRLTDKEFEKLLNSEDEDNCLIYGNNNWFEVDMILPDGQYVDLSFGDNVLDDNILEAFEDVDEYFPYIAEALA